MEKIHKDEDYENNSSEDEWMFDLLNIDMKSVREEFPQCEYNSDDNSSSDSDVVQAKRKKVRCLSSSSEENNNISNEDLSQDDGGWVDVTENDPNTTKIPFTTSPKIPGPQIPQAVTEPLHFFQLFFTDELINNIIKDTNEYANNKISANVLSKRSLWNTWKNVGKEEFLAFIATILNMGTMPLCNIHEYWSTNEASYIPFYANTFTRDRFSQIFWMLHLRQIPTADKSLRTRLQKVSLYLEYLDDKFSTYFIPNQHISVDESVVKFKGKVSFITYNPNKPTKWGIRVYVLADARTGYIFSILPYYGSLTSEKLTNPDLPITARIPLTLYQKLMNKIPTGQGFHIYTDRYYTSIPLAEELLKKKCYLTGTIKCNRKGIPAAIKKPKFTTSRKSVFFRKNNLLLNAWKDKRQVTMLSTWGQATMHTITRINRGGNVQTVQKPTIVLDYTKHMGGVDRADHYAASYPFMRKSLKWWRKLFFWGLEVSVVNAYILYKDTKVQRNEKPMTHLQFVKKLILQLRGDFRRTVQPQGQCNTSETENRLDGKLHIPRLGSNKDCRVCSDRKIKGGRKRTTTYCSTCPGNPSLHIGDCFERYHTFKNYKN